MNNTAFKRAWKKKEAAGYQYGDDALEQVRFGFEIAVQEIIETLEAHTCVSTCCDYQKPGTDLEVIEAIKKHFLEKKAQK